MLKRNSTLKTLSSIANQTASLPIAKWFYRPYPRRLESYHLQMLLQRQYFLPSYLKTLCVGPATALNPQPPAQ